MGKLQKDRRVGALRSKSLKMAARYAESWNSLTGPGLWAKEALEYGYDRSMVECCVDRETLERLAKKRSRS
jgi:hypothetical protein